VVLTVAVLQGCGPAEALPTSSCVIIKRELANMDGVAMIEFSTKHPDPQKRKKERKAEY
jgi:hypothetical protein